MKGEVWRRPGECQTEGCVWWPKKRVDVCVYVTLRIRYVERTRNGNGCGSFRHVTFYDVMRVVVYNTDKTGVCTAEKFSLSAYAEGLAQEPRRRYEGKLLLFLLPCCSGESASSRIERYQIR